MKVIDPGHVYELAQLDGDSLPPIVLRFVKRVGLCYPGNEKPPYPGTNMQDVIRVLIDRLQHVKDQAHDLDDQESASTDWRCIKYLREVLWQLEERAARRHGRPWPCVGVDAPDVEHIATCGGCGHIGCEGTCGR